DRPVRLEQAGLDTRAAHEGDGGGIGGAAGGGRRVRGGDEIGQAALACGEVAVPPPEYGVERPADGAGAWRRGTGGELLAAVGPTSVAEGQRQPGRPLHVDQTEFLQLLPPVFPEVAVVVPGEPHVWHRAAFGQQDEQRGRLHRGQGFVWHVSVLSGSAGER